LAKIYNKQDTYWFTAKAEYDCSDDSMHSHINMGSHDFFQIASTSMNKYLISVHCSQHSILFPVTHKYG